MRKYNVITALFLVMTILLSQMVAFSAFSEPREMLTALNIMEKPDNQQIVSRGEMATYLVRLIGEENMQASESAFADLKQSDKFHNAISIMEKYGIMHGDENGFVYAENPVTFNEAVKMIMCLLGYSEYAQVRGGYPMGYLRAAREKNLLDGVKERGDGWLEEDEAAKLLYNALSVPIMGISEISSDGKIKYEGDEEKTLLWEYRGLTRGEGIVTAVPGIDGVEKNVLKAGFAAIDAKVYRTEVNAEALLGYKVEFYYDEDGTIFALVPAKRNETLTVKAENVYRVTSDGFYYDEKNNGNGNIRIGNDTEVYYNNALIASLRSFNPEEEKEGFVTAIDNDGDGTYEYVFINVYYDFLVGAVDKSHELIYDFFNSERVINLDDNVNNVTITDDYGIEMTVDDIFTGQHFTIWESYDGKTVYLHCNENEVSGTVEKIIKEDDTTMLIINGEQYSTSRYFEDNYSVAYLSGGRFTLNKFGQIAAFFEKSNLKTGYVIAGEKTSRISSDYKVRIFTEDGEFLIYTVSDKVDCDENKKNNNAETFYRMLCAGTDKVVPQLIRYRINDDGLLSYAELSDSRSGEHLNLLCELQSAAYVSASEIFGGKVRVTASTKLFLVPKADADMDEDDYRVLSAPQYFERSTGYDAKAYRTNTSSHYAETLVVQVDLNKMDFNVYSPVAIFDRIVYNKDENGEFKAHAEVYTGSVKKTVPLYSEAVLKTVKDENQELHTLKRGDVIRYRTTQSGEIATLTLMYNRETQKTVGAKTSGGWDASFHYNCGYAYDVYDGNLWVSANEPNDVMSVADLSSYQMMNIIVYDSFSDELSLANADDIRDYTHTGNPAQVFVCSRYAETALIFSVK